MKNKAAGLVLGAVLVLGGLAGAPRDALARRELAAVRACMTISADAQRLACYDRALGVKRAQQAERAEQARQAERAQQAESTRAARSGSAPAARNEPPAVERRASAGEQEQRTPRETVTSGRTREQEPAEVEVTVVQVRQATRLDQAVFITKDGQVWRQIDDKHVMYPRSPFRAVISPGSLGSHFLRPEGERVDIQVIQQ